MRDLVDAAVASAARSGVQAAIILVGGNAPHGERQEAERHSGELPPPPPLDDGAVDDRLRQAIAQRDKALAEHAAMRQTVAELNAKLHAAAQATTPVTAAPAAEQCVAVAEYEECSLEMITLSDKSAALCRKKGIDTVGKLRGAFMAGELVKWKLPRADIISACEQLLGRVPSGRGLKAPAGTAPTAAAPAGGAAGAGVPAGHTDRAWLERLKVARVKQAKGDRIKAVLAKQEAEIREKLGVTCDESYSHPVFVTALVNQLIAHTAQPPENVKLVSDFLTSRGHRGVAYAQATSLIWALGFDPKTADRLDPALKAAGLVHLMESAPEPVGV